MKQRYLKPIAVILLTLMLSLPLTLGGTVLAADEGSISAGETKDFELVYDDTLTLQFTPEETGFYSLILTDDLPYHITLEDENHEYIYSSYSFWLSDFPDELIYKYEAGKNYYFTMYPTRFIVEWNTPDSEIIADFTLSLEFLGDLESLEITSLPTHTTYIYGYDAFTFEDYLEYIFEVDIEDILNDPDVDEDIKGLIDNHNGVVYFDYTNLEITATFSKGATRIFDYSNSDFYDELKEKIKIGENTLVVSIFDCIFLELDITVIENPVESIEIAYMPEIEPIFIDWIDVAMGIPTLQKYFDEMPPLGTQIQINYTDGTSKIITIEENEIYYVIDDYPLYVELDYLIEGTDELFFTIDYLGHTTSYTVEFTFSHSVDHVFSILARILNIFNMVLSILWSFGYY